ncbi:MAG: HIT family protein [Casimicrobium sp.]
MQTHEPHAYLCPFCKIVAGGEDPSTLIWQDEVCFATVALHQKQGNHGSLLLIPKQHYESLYVLPEHLGAQMFKITKSLAIALKVATKCDGITVRQNNEPAGGQDVWHYHTHIIPRYKNDDFNAKTAFVMPLPERVELARRVRSSLGV